MNSVFQQLNGNNILAQFIEFKRTFNGDPKEEVQKLLDSGRLTQEQFNKLSEQATQLQKFFSQR